MKVNFVTQRYYPNNNVQFGQARQREQEKLSRSTCPDLGEVIKEINHDFDVKSSYLSEIARDVRMSPVSYQNHKHKLQAHRDMMIAKLVGEDYNYEEAEDFIERLTY